MKFVESSYGYIVNCGLMCWFIKDSRFDMDKLMDKGMIAAYEFSWYSVLDIWEIDFEAPKRPYNQFLLF